MFKLFIVCCKLLGVLCIVKAIQMLTGLLFYIPELFDSLEMSRYREIWYFLGILLGFFGLLVFAYGLIFKTETLSRWIRLDRENSPIPKVQAFFFAKIGFSLLGLYILILSLPDLLMSTGFLIYTELSGGDQFNRYWGSAAAGLVQVIIGLVLLDKAIPLAQRLTGSKEEAADV